MISQPTFLPWLGWFDLVSICDVVILLDTVQFNKRSWQQRNRIRTKDGLEFITVPVFTAGKSKQKIKDVMISDKQFYDYFFRKIKTSYSKSNHYDAVINDIRNTLPYSVFSNHLVDLNNEFIYFIMRWFCIRKNIIKASELDVNVGVRGEYLAMLCEAVGANEYISTPGAHDYLCLDIFEFRNRNINVFISDYQHPEYNQAYSPFIPFASSLDLIMNYGENSNKIMKNSKRTINILV